MIMNLNNCLQTSLLILTIGAVGCGQKGPLYLDETQDGTEKRVEPKDEKRLEELKELEQQNESQPVITY